MQGMNRVLGLWLVGLGWAAAAADLPPLVLPEGVGVNIHFTRGHERDLDMIAAAGFKFVRMDFSWSATERKKGEYNWADYDELTANLEKRGLRALYILDYSNGLYEDAIESRDPISGRLVRDIAAPRKPESIAAFARWAGAAAAHFKGRRILWEIWNEPNIGFWKPEPNVTNYAKLVLATCPAIRAADPQATIVAPASSGFPWAFFEELFKAGALAHLDAVSVHPYRSYSLGPETAGKDYQRLRTLIERHAPEGKRHLPILSGEWGYATHAKGGVSLDTQAAFIARQQLANLYYGVPLSIWYDWKNDGTDPNYNEHNFGTVSNNLAPKPAYWAVQTLTRQLSGYRVARRLDAGHPEAWVLLCVNAAGDQKLAAWTTGQPRPATLELRGLAAEDVAAVDVTGQPVALQVESGRLQLSLQPGPQYVTLKRRFKELTAAAAWELRPVRSLVEAGQAQGIVVPVQIRNPFAQPLTAEARLEGVGTADPVQATVPAHQTAVLTLTSSIRRRWPEHLHASVHLSLSTLGSDPAAAVRWQGTEPLEFTLANPLRLELAPVQGGLRLHIDNPAGRPFTGLVRLGEAESPVRLSDGQPQASRVLAPSPAARSLHLIDAHDQVVAELPVPLFEPVAADRLRAVLDGDGRVPAQAELAVAEAPGPTERPSDRAWKLDYRFGSGWRFVRVVVDGPKLPPLQKRPQGLGLWVYGDSSRNLLRIRLTDSAGQTFQPNGPALTWTGWRWVTFDVADLHQAGHWGGPADGRVREPLRLDTLLVLDSTRQPSTGTIWLAGPTWIYPAPEQGACSGSPARAEGTK